MRDRPVLVVGARGTTGSRVAARLRAAGVPVRAASRRPDAVAPEPGTVAVAFDWADPSTWAPALTGCRATYLVTTGVADHERAAAGLAGVAADVGARVVLLSSRAWARPGFEAHAADEAAVRASGASWTIVRAAWSAQYFHTHVDAAVRAGVLRLPAGRGREAFVDAADVADVAVAALPSDAHEGRTYEVSGPEPLSVAEACARITALTGLVVRYEAVSEEDALAALAADGVAPQDAWSCVRRHRAVAQGAGDHVSDGVARVLGRPARDFDAFVRAAVARRVWPAP